MKCLNCSSIDIGKIGKHHYYCWNCYIEFTINGEKLDLFQVEKDGTVSSLNDLFFDEELQEVKEIDLTQNTSVI